MMVIGWLLLDGVTIGILAEVMVEVSVDSGKSNSDSDGTKIMCRFGGCANGKKKKRALESAKGRV